MSPFLRNRLWKLASGSLLPDVPYIFNKTQIYTVDKSNRPVSHTVADVCRLTSGTVQLK